MKKIIVLVLCFVAVLCLGVSASAVEADLSCTSEVAPMSTHASYGSYSAAFSGESASITRVCCGASVSRSGARVSLREGVTYWAINLPGGYVSIEFDEPASRVMSGEATVNGNTGYLTVWC